MDKFLKFMFSKCVNKNICTARHFHVQQFPELDFEYLCDVNNWGVISKNIELRKGVGDITLVQDLKRKLYASFPHNPDYEEIKSQLYKEALKIPNKTCSSILYYENEPKVKKTIGEPRPFDFSFSPRQFHEIAKRLNLVRTDQLGNLTGNRSYFFLGEMSQLQDALIQYTIGKLLKNQFNLISVPDILPRNVIESCGMNTRSERTQVYSLDPELHDTDLCLSGTSEMALAGLFANKTFDESELPLKLCAVSRCYRAETSSIAEERGIFRVHEFSKVEMFAITTPDKSDETLEDFLQIQEDLFTPLGLHLKVLDMPPPELGAPAYRKYDIEAWLPGRDMFGEISSCSNCTDYQSRRLGIKYKINDKILHAHTINGTACAIPRMLIGLVETHQHSNGTIEIPEVLRKYMDDKTCFGRQKGIPELKLVKHKK